MPFIVIVIGAIIAIAAFNNAHGDLGRALVADIPGYFKWAIAIAAILGLGFVPGMKVPSRYLVALVAVVIVLLKYKDILDGFRQFAQISGAPAGTGATDPTAAYVQSGGAGGLPSQTQIAGEPSGGTSASQVASQISPSSAGQVLTAAQTLAANPLNPNSYIGLAAGFGGLA